jgi:uncharacterized delta-60 repeat protein
MAQHHAPGRPQPARAHLAAPPLLVVVTALAFALALAAGPTPSWAAGQLDTTFDTDGKVVTDLGTDDTGRGVAVQADGKIVVAGDSGGDFGLARYNDDGSLDTTFGVGGKVVTDFGQITDRAGAVVIQGEKIVVAGYTSPSAGGVFDPTGRAVNFALARYNANGSLDTSFDGDGKVVTDFGLEEVALAVAIQGGKIVVAGTQHTNISTQINFAVARYNDDGSLDTTFDGDGMVVTDIGANDFGQALATEGEQIVVAGYTSATVNPGSSDNFALARYNTDGSLDTSFDGDGRVVTDFGGADEAFGLAFQAGKIVAAGYSFPSGGTHDFALARYNADGSLDTSFDGDGRVKTDIAGHDVGQAVAIQGDKMVVAGYSYTATGTQNFALARHNADGSLDTSFDGDGKVVTDFGAADVAHALAIQGEKIVAAGYSDTGPNPPNFAVARYDEGYPRPSGASPMRVSLVPAYAPCISANRQHGPPLSFPSCNPPQQVSGQLTVGTPDSNGRPANSIGYARFAVTAGDPSTPQNEADVRVSVSMTDVRLRSDLSDHTGELQVNPTVRITDRNNGASGTDRATTEDTPFPITTPCAATASSSVGATCSLTSSFNAIVPGAVVEGKRAIWQLGSVEVLDGGSDGAAATGPNALFARQGIFIP